MAMKPNTKKIFQFLQDLDGADTFELEGVTVPVISEYVAQALDLTKKQVDGSFTSAIARNGQYGMRVESEMTLEDGTHKAIKLLKLNEAGQNFDLSSVESDD